MKQFKKEGAITLMALVVTVIIIVILASVTIDLLIGKDGLLNRFKEGRDNYALAANEERVILLNIEEQLDEQITEIESTF